MFSEHLKGQMSGDMFNGQGTKYFANRHKYTGDWVDNRMEGLGIYTWPNGDRYEVKYSKMSCHNYW